MVAIATIHDLEVPSSAEFGISLFVLARENQLEIYKHIGLSIMYTYYISYFIELKDLSSEPDSLTSFFNTSILTSF